MKRMLLLILCSISFAGTPFNRGVNLTQWFQVGSPNEIQFSKFTRTDFENIKSLGCDVIRLPINLHFMTGGAPDYTLDPLFLGFLDQAVDWAEELELHLILDNHTFDPAQNTDPNIGDVLVPVWKQMATHYKERSNFLYYEILNEPHGLSDPLWNSIQGRVIDSIRTIDKKHTIIVGPANWNSYNNLSAMPAYPDTNLIYTFHFYDPFLFTHQGAGWVSPSMEPLAGVPFPYDQLRMPPMPASFRGSWLESAYNNYRTEGNATRVKQLLDIAASFSSNRNVTVFCGEFGVYMLNSDPNDRVQWYEIVRTYLEEKGIPWTIWDYTGDFGIFEKGGGNSFDHDVNIPLVEALGLTAPEQKEYILRPDSVGFSLFEDFVSSGITVSNWMSSGRVDYYSTAAPYSGEHCLEWTGANQYNHVGFDFQPNKNLTKLVSEGYVLDFWIRCNNPDAQFDMRFVDSKTTEPGDHPWRMRAKIDASRAPFDGQWHHVQIPLASFEEHGSWDNGWFDPQGKYDWSDVDLFQIAAEYMEMSGITVWFDDIAIVDPNLSSVDFSPVNLPECFALHQNYPNPFNNSTFISFDLDKQSRIKLTIFNTKGQLVAEVINSTLPAGKHRIAFSADELSSGLYFYTLEGEAGRMTKKMILAR